MRIFLTTLLLLCLLASAPRAHAYTNDCPGWARQLQAKPYAKSVNMLGCIYTGAWVARSGTCNYYARQQARLGYRGYQVFYRISPKGCAMDDRGVYYSYTVR